MSYLRLSTLSLALLATTATIASAHDTKPIDRTQAWQLEQIQRGRGNGSLTRREYEALVAEQTRIAEMERRAQRNGVTGREYRAIRQAQRAAGAHILQESTDRQVNVWRRWKSRHFN